MDKVYVGLVLFAVLMFSLLGYMMYRDLPASRELIVESIYYDLWYAEAPFGRFWIQETGEIHGGMFLFVGGVSGSWETNLKESYILKYHGHDGNIHSITLPADETPFTFDGTYKLEKINRHMLVTKNSGEQYLSWWDENHNRIDTEDWVLHLPAEPKANETMTLTWDGQAWIQGD